MIKLDMTPHPKSAATRLFVVRLTTHGTMEHPKSALLSVHWSPVDSPHKKEWLMRKHFHGMTSQCVPGQRIAVTVAPSTPAYHTDHSVQKTYPTTTGPQLSNKPVLHNHDAAVSRDSPREKQEVPRKRKKEENDVIDVDEYGLDTVDIGMLLLAWGYNATHAHTRKKCIIYMCVSVCVCLFVCVCVFGESSQDAEGSQGTRKGLKAANVPNCHYPCFLCLFSYSRRARAEAICCRENSASHALCIRQK